MDTQAERGGRRRGVQTGTYRLPLESDDKSHGLQAVLPLHPSLSWQGGSAYLASPPTSKPASVRVPTRAPLAPDEPSSPRTPGWPTGPGAPGRPSDPAGPGGPWLPLGPDTPRSPWRERVKTLRNQLSALCWCY